MEVAVVAVALAVVVVSFEMILLSCLLKRPLDLRTDEQTLL